MTISDYIFLEFYITYHLPVVSDTVVISGYISIFYIRCQLSVISCQIPVISCQISASIDISSYWRYQLLLHSNSCCLFANKWHHNPKKRGNCL